MAKWIVWVVIMAILGIIGLSLVGAVISTANAQAYRGPASASCDDYSKITAFYERASGKVPVARGLGNDGKVIEVLANEDGGFTILIVMAGADKWTCVVKQGVGWGEVKHFLKENEAL